MFTALAAIRALAGAALLFAGGFVYVRFWMGPGPRELQRLRRERQVLSERLEGRLRERAHLWDKPGTTVLIGVPSRLAESLAGDVIVGLVPEVKLTLRDLRVSKEDEVHATMVVGRRTVGRFVLNVDLDEVKVTLRPGKPRLAFANDRIRVSLPVKVAEGSARGRLRFRWDARGMAGAVCGDFDVTQDVAGSAVPHTHVLEGAVGLADEGRSLVAKPELGEVTLKVPIAPSAETWRFVDHLIAGRSGLCRAALKTADLRERIRDLLARGVNVTVPGHLLTREVHLPAAIEQSIALPGRAIRLEVRPAGFTLLPTRLWYGASVELREDATPDVPVTESKEGGAPTCMMSPAP